jgi:hypothetical protein
MKKIPTLFQRNYETDRLVRDEVTPGCEWVIQGEGIATRKLDGTCCLVRDGKLYKRYELKPGRIPPTGFEPVSAVDTETGKVPGWVPVGDGPEDQWHREALHLPYILRDGTYELVGPKVQGNPEHYDYHTLWAHKAGDLTFHPLQEPPRDFAGLRAFLSTIDIEGIVWHHPDGRMAKIKGRDFGLRRPK